MKVLKVGIAGYGIVGKRRHHFIDLNPNLKFLYATAKALNEKSQKKDFKIAAYLYWAII